MCNFSFSAVYWCFCEITEAYLYRLARYENVCVDVCIEWRLAAERKTSWSLLWQWMLITWLRNNSREANAKLVVERTLSIHIFCRLCSKSHIYLLTQSLFFNNNNNFYILAVEGLFPLFFWGETKKLRFWNKCEWKNVEIRSEIFRISWDVSERKKAVFVSLCQ